MEQSYITKSHAERLPTVRIKKAVLENFKNVEYGEITFFCGCQFVPCGTQSDILGIYGQNGSGKTSLIEALSILKSLMSGTTVPSAYADCVSIDTGRSRLEFIFDLQYPDGTVREATYSFSLVKEELTREEMEERPQEDTPLPDQEYKLVITDEKFSLLWEDASKRQVIIDTSTKRAAFGPETKRRLLVDGNSKTLVALQVNKQIAKSQSRSFIFMNETLQLLRRHDGNSLFFQVLVELRWFARHFLFVVDTKSSGIIRLNFALPLYMREGVFLFDMQKPKIIALSVLDEVRGWIKSISSVLEQLVPGLTLDIKDLSSTLDKSGKPAAATMLIACRDGKELPLRDESDGVRKIISVLSLIVAAFNQQSTTVAIDEFDAGVFEYLLGEILQILQERGKGQFIFTSHNLRPLEVLDRKFLYFTTTNPRNRYIRLKNIAPTNNLRDTYFREILLNEQGEKIYNRTKRFKIISALVKAEGGT